MNKHLYRVIFSKTRGIWIVVAELARRQGKGKCKPISTALPQKPVFRARPIVLSVLIATGAPFAWVETAVAEIRVDNGAPASQRPTLGQSANGTPLVNIQTPSAAGVSRNTYSQFDVGRQGVILNNSRVPTNTHIGGFVASNPNLGRGEASLILNEVNAANPSVLNGFIEVAGRRAQVVVANPAGITCDGCGFINTSRSTLTTGRPLIENGGLSGYRVETGTIEVKGRGLNADDSDYTDLIARVVKVNADIQASELRVTTGRNEVSADNLAADPLDADADGDAPEFALDVAHLGGMYAGKIFLVGTEKGVGVRNAGEIGASTGELSLTADGRLINTGLVSAATDVKVAMSGDVDNTGSIYARRDTRIDTGGDIANERIVAAGRHVRLDAGEDIESGNTSILAAGVDDTLSANETGQLDLDAGGAVAANGRNMAAEDLNIDAASVDLSDSKTQAENIALSSSRGDIDTARASVSTTGTLRLETAGGALSNHEGLLEADRLEISVAAIDNRQGRLVQTGEQDLQLLLDGKLDNRDGVIATNSRNAEIDARHIDNSGGVIGHAGEGGLFVDGVGLDNRDGLLQSNGHLELTVETHLDNRRGLAAGDRLDIRADTLNNQAGKIEQRADSSQGAMRFTGALDNRAGRISTRGDLALEAYSIDNRNGVIASIEAGPSGPGAALTIDAAYAIDNAGGLISSADLLRLNADRLDNSERGWISSDSGIDIVLAAGLDNNDGRLIAQEALSISSGGTLDNTDGLLQSGSDMRLSTENAELLNVLSEKNQRLNADAALDRGIASAGRLDVSSGKLNNQRGYIGAAGATRFDVASLDNRHGYLNGSADIHINSVGLLDNRHATISGNRVNLQSGEPGNEGYLDNRLGLIQSRSALSIDINGGVLDNGATSGSGGIVSQEDLVVRAGRLTNDNGYIGATASIDVGLDTLDNTAGTLLAEGDLSLSAGQVDNVGGLMQSGATLAVTASSVDNGDTRGEREGLRARDLDLRVDTLDNRQGFIGASDQNRLQVAYHLINTDGLITSLDRAVVHDSGLGQLVISNDGGEILAARAIAMTAVALAGTGGVETAGDIVLNLLSDFDHSGELRADNNLTMTITGDLINNGKLSAVNQLSIEADNIDNRSDAEISAVTTLLDASGQILNRGLIDGQMTHITTALLDNLGSGRVYGDHLAIDADTVRNRMEGAVAGTLAARNRLDLGVGDLENRDGALIFSGGDLAIGGELDGSNKATGRVGHVLNASSTIEALGGVDIDVDRLENIDEHYSLDKVEVGDTSHREYQPRGSSARYDHDKVRWGRTRRGESKIVWPVEAEDFYVYEYRRIVAEDRIANLAPAQLLAGGNMRIDAEHVLNDQSKILAGGTLTVNAATLENKEIKLERSSKDNGTVYFTWVKSCGKDDHCRVNEPRSAYRPPAVIETLSTLSGVVDQHMSISPGNAGPDAHIAKGSEKLALGAGDVHANSAHEAGELPGSLSLDTPGEQPIGDDDLDRVGRTGGVLNLPSSSLFSTNLGDVDRPLIETDERFTSYRNWLNSNYALGKLPNNGDLVQRRLGDGFVEQRLVQQQIAQLTGQRYLAGYNDDEEQYRDLLDAGVSFALAYDLKPGIALSEAQIAQLTSDIVWLVEQTVRLGNGSTVKVLVPQVYAVVQQGDLNGGGALLGGRNVDLTIGDRLINSGRLLAEDTLLAASGDIENRQGAIAARQQQLKATGDIVNESGLIQAEDTLIVQADGDIDVGSLVRVATSEVGANRFERVTLDGIGTLMVTGPNATLSTAAGGDLNLRGAAVVNTGEGGQTTLTAGNDINVDSVTTRRRDAMVWDARNHLTMGQSNEVGSLLSGEGDITLAAGRDLNIRASHIDTDGALVGVAGRDIAIDAGEDTRLHDENHYFRDSGFLSKKTTVRRYYRESTTVQGSTISAGSAHLDVGRDVGVTGSSIVTDGDLALRAGRDITIDAAENSRRHSDFVSKKKSGIMSGGSFGVFVGTRQQASDIAERQTQQVGSTLGSLSGNVSLVADNDVRVRASDILARDGNVRLEGDNVHLDAGHDTLDRDERHTYKQSGLTIALSGGAVSAVQQIQHSAERIDGAEDDRLRALHAWRIARVAQDLPAQTEQLQHAIENGTSAGSGVNLSVSLGSSKSEQTHTVRNRTALGSSVIADGDVAIVARGDADRAGSGDIVSRGSLIEGHNIRLDAHDAIELRSAENQRRDDSESRSSSAGIGISFGSDGFNVFVEGSQARGEENRSDDRYLETQVNAREQVEITSGGDTLLEGAQVNAEQITARIGGDLNIVSQQDREHYRNRQNSMGGRVGVGIGPSAPVNLNLNYSELKADAEYVAVQEQSGFFAGQGGFDVEVGGNTHLEGGAIVSSADAAANRLSTETLSYNELRNHAEYDIESKSIGFSTGLSGNLLSDPGQALKGGGLPGGLSGGYAQDSDSASNTTYAAISDGDIEVRANPGVSLDGLKRSREQAHQVLERIFDEGKVDAIEEQRELTQIFAEEAYIQVGNLYEEVENLEGVLAADEAAAEKGENLLTEAQRRQIEDRAAQLRETLPDKAIAHALVGGITALIGGGNFMQGAAAAGLNELAAQQLAEQLPESDLLRNLAAVAIGSVVGGQQGGLITGTADRYNRQLHPKEIDWIEANVEAFATHLSAQEGRAVSEGEARFRLVQQALKEIDLGMRLTLDHGIDEQASAYLQTAQETFENELGKAQQLFTVEGNQYVRPELYLYETDLAYYRENVHPGVEYTPGEGLTAFLNDYKEKGDAFIADLPEKTQAEVKRLLQAYKDNPEAVTDYLKSQSMKAAQRAAEGVVAVIALQQCLKSMECVAGKMDETAEVIGEIWEDISDGFKRQGKGLVGSGEAVFDDETAKRLNEIYGQDVSGMAQTILAANAGLVLLEVVPLAKAGKLAKIGGKFGKDKPDADRSQLPDTQKTDAGDGGTVVSEVTPDNDNSLVGELEPGNPRSSSIPRDGDRLVLDQGRLPTCGPNSCAMVLDSSGKKFDLNKLIADSKVTSQGAYMGDMAQALRNQGLVTARVKNRVTIEQLAEATSNGNPAVVATRLDRGGHAVVVDGITMRQGQMVVAIRDPALGRQYFTPLDEFSERFSGQAILTNSKNP